MGHRSGCKACPRLHDRSVGPREVGEKRRGRDCESASGRVAPRGRSNYLTVSHYKTCIDPIAIGIALCSPTIRRSGFMIITSIE